MTLAVQSSLVALVNFWYSLVMTYLAVCVYNTALEGLLLFDLSLLFFGVRPKRSHVQVSWGALIIELVL